MWVVILTSGVVLLPTLGMVIWAANSDSGIIVVVAALVGLLNGIAAAWVLGHVAIEYLRTRMVDVFSRIRYARTFSEGTSDGLLDWMAQGHPEGRDQRMQAAEAESARRQARPRRPTGRVSGEGDSRRLIHLHQHSGTPTARARATSSAPTRMRMLRGFAALCDPSAETTPGADQASASDSFFGDRMVTTLESSWAPSPAASAIR